MMFQTVTDGTTGDVCFRVVRSSLTATSTVTIAAGTPLILETATASANGVFAAQAAALATAVINNLYVGNAHAAIAPGAVGLVQCYGLDTDAIVATAGAAAGAVLVPAGTTLATSTVNFAAGALITVLVAPTGATTAATAVFLRAL